MFKMVIKNLQGTMIGGCVENTQQEAEALIESRKLRGDYGKVAGVYNESVLSEEEKVGAVEILPEGDQLFIERQFQIQDQFTVEQVDISAQIEQERINKESLKFLADTDWMVVRSLEDPSKPVPEDIKTQRQQARERIVR